MGEKPSIRRKNCPHEKVHWDIDYYANWDGPENLRSLSYLVCHCEDCGHPLDNRRWFKVSELRGLAAFLNKVQIRSSL